MTFSLIASTKTTGAGTGGSTSGGAGTRDTTGAKLFVLVASHYVGATAAVSDSHGNTYTALSVIGNSEARCSVFYCVNPTTGTATDWTLSGSGLYGVLHVVAFSSDTAVEGVDVQNATAYNAASGATGSITPTGDNRVIVVGAAAGGNSGTFSIDGGFTIPSNGQSPGIASASYSGAVAYLIQTTAAAANPTVTFPVSSQAGLKIVAFKAAAATAALSGNVTLDAVAPAGTLADAGPTSLSGNVTLDAVAPSGTLGLQPGTVTVSALKNWSGSLQTSVTIPVVTVLSMTTGAQVLALTDQTTHATTADLAITSTSLVAGTTYMVAGWSADGSQRFAVPLTAT